MHVDTGVSRPVVQNLVLVVDDDVFFRRSVVSLLKRRRYETLEAADAQSAYQLAVDKLPGAVVVDIVLPERPHIRSRTDDNHGVELVRLLKTTDPSIAAVLVSAFPDRSHVILPLASAGVRGLAYLIKGIGTNGSVLLQALRETRAGYVLIRTDEPGGAAALAARFRRYLTEDEMALIGRASVLFPTLTNREVEVAYLLAHAQTVEGVAVRLNISPDTAEKHISRIYHKLELDRADDYNPSLRKSLLLAKTCWLLDLLGNTNGA
jgi:DNA-binding NarL/FixJ family response regulator